ncbi:MAG: sialate O-acetylesterase [Phycisphaerae bacterium]|jgi:alpha-galactosidase|nr:sialate O-acetylesterase [Phycisphaerae bacterium]
MKHRSRIILIIAVGLLGSVQALQAADKKIKVFILAGQSNMEGHGQVRSLPHLGNHPKHGHLLKKLKGPDGKWAVRDDVTISYKAPQRNKRSGSLTVGWGGEKHELGPELMFGTIMGDKYDEHVLLIKTAWGGKDVICDFRSPSAGKPRGAEAAFFAHRRKEGDRREIGVYYRKMVAEIKETLDNIKNVVPGYKGQGYEIAGMAWFQGWNDLGAWHFQKDGEHLGKEVLGRYKQNLSAMIRDLRKDLNAPDMPVAIGELGVGGHEMTKRAEREGRDWEAESIVELRKLQKAVGDDPKLKNVTFVPTLDYWDVRLQELRVISDAYWGKKQKAGIKDTEQNHLPTKELNDEFLRLGQHWFCHYNGSAANYSLIGWALAEALNKLGADKTRKSASR